MMMKKPNDNIIDAAQFLLKNQYHVSGLQHVCLSYTLAYKIQQSEFMQLLHTGSSHWLLVTNIGAKEDQVLFYDSLYSSIGTNTKLQIASILSSRKSKEISVDCQRQKGGSDCGVLANGVQPENLSFKQDTMRKHLYNCLSIGDVPFKAQNMSR